MSAAELAGVFELLLANLTPAVMLSSLDHINSLIAKEGTCILSGFMHSHLEEIKKVMKNKGFRIIWTAEDGIWHGKGLFSL